MTLTPPEWLTKRGGGLRPTSDPRVWFVMIRDQPQYRLAPVPVAGKFGCSITQTVNGRAIPCAVTADSAEEALRAGLEELRKALGW